MSITDPKPKSRPAIPKDPLRLPGQSLREELESLLLDKALPLILLVVLAGLFTALELVRLLIPKSNPNLLSCVALTITTVIASVWALKRLIALRKDVDTLRLGLRGEIHVGQYLNETCTNLGYRILHDFPGDDFNIDHILIGPGGIFVVEVKNWILPGERGDITFDGESITRSDRPNFPESRPVDQVRNNADYLRKLIAQLTARDPKSLPIRPVLIFPGWFMPPGITFKHDVWVLADNNLHAILTREHERLSPAEIAPIYANLTNYIRNRKT